jgi:hypothetical protein
MMKSFSGGGGIFEKWWKMRFFDFWKFPDGIFEKWWEMRFLAVICVESMDLGVPRGRN